MVQLPRLVSRDVLVEHVPWYRSQKQPGSDHYDQDIVQEADYGYEIRQQVDWGRQVQYQPQGYHTGPDGDSWVSEEVSAERKLLPKDSFPMRFASRRSSERHTRQTTKAAAAASTASVTRIRIRITRMMSFTNSVYRATDIRLTSPSDNCIASAALGIGIKAIAWILYEASPVKAEMPRVVRFMLHPDDEPLRVLSGRQWQAAHTERVRLGFGDNLAALADDLDSGVSYRWLLPRSSASFATTVTVTVRPSGAGSTAIPRSSR